METILPHLPQIIAAITGPGALVVVLIFIIGYVLYLITPIVRGVLPMLKEFFANLTKTMEKHQAALESVTNTLEKVSQEIDYNHKTMATEITKIHEKITRLETLSEVYHNRNQLRMDYETNQ